MSELEQWLQYELATLHGDEVFRRQFEQVIRESMPKLKALIAERERAARIEALQYAHDLDPSLPDEEHCTCLPWLQWKLEEEIDRLATLTKEGEA